MRSALNIISGSGILAIRIPSSVIDQGEFIIRTLLSIIYDEWSKGSH